MEERGMKGDPMYSQARQLLHSLVSHCGKLDGPGGPSGGGPAYPVGERPPSSCFQNPQLLQLRAQIMAYRMLVKHQPLPPQIDLTVTGKREIHLLNKGLHHQAALLHLQQPQTRQ